jgi:multiple sugar transport system permease protein
MENTRGLSFSKDKKQAAIFLIPACFYLLVLTMYPLGYSVFLSLTDWSLLDRHKAISFVGLKRFIDLFKDPEFLNSMLFTFKFYVAALPLEILLGLFLALIIVSEKLHRITANSLRVVVIIPVIIMPAVVGILWGTMFTIRYGPINYFVSLLGLPEISWLGNPNWAYVSVLMVELWRYNPLVTLIFVGGLLGVPKDQVESARIDGCSGFRVFWHVTLPYLRPIILVALLLRSMDLVKRFDFIYTLTHGGPGFSTMVATIYIQKVGIEDFRFNDAAAAAWVLVLVVLPITLFMIFRMFVPRE